MKRKVCIISHSAADLRQQLFYQELSRQGLDILVLAPRKWLYHRNDDVAEDNYQLKALDVVNEGNMSTYYFPDGYRYLREFKPEIVYLQQEPFHLQTMLGVRWAREIGAKIVVFTWQNIPYKFRGIDADLIIAGNSEAAELHNTDVVLPQVGIDTDLFRPMPEIEKEFDLVFVGRDTPEKGTQVIREAIKGLVTSRDIKILWREGFLNYDQLPPFFNRAKIHLSPSIDTAGWKEQAGNYSNCEALLCGLSVVTSNSAAIVEWLDECPSVIFVPQNDPAALREAFLKTETPGRGREWIKARYSNEAVAKKLIKVFEGIV